MGEHLALRSEDHAVAIEDQLVLAADRVHPCDERAVISGPAGDHRLARAALAFVVGRAVDVDHQLDAVVSLPRHRAGRIPAVLTH